MIKIYSLVYGKSVLGEDQIYKGGGREKQPITFSIFLVQTEKDLVLIDAGCDYMPGFNMREYFSPAFVLRQQGFSPKDITDVIITHSHHDHIEALKHFSNATVHINRDEYESGREYIPKGAKLNVFDDKVLVANCLEVIKWGGHSKGSSIVKYRNLIFAGDECYTNSNIEAKIPTGAYFDQTKSQEFVEKFASKEYNVYTCHDISLKTQRIL
jgi:glyoxylase-like metal-dependent hydrolase (beta-lactamase superfamily II)